MRHTMLYIAIKTYRYIKQLNIHVIYFQNKTNRQAVSIYMLYTEHNFLRIIKLWYKELYLKMII